jgi:hypothetical protein
LAGFRYALVLENGEPADPAGFATALPDWKIGDEFLASSFERFRILAIEPEMDDDAESHGYWVVRLRSRAAQPLRAAGRER